MKDNKYPLDVRVVLLVVLSLCAWGVIIGIAMGMLWLVRELMVGQLIVIGTLVACVVWAAYMRWVYKRYPKPLVKRWIDKRKEIAEGKWYEGKNAEALSRVAKYDNVERAWRGLLRAMQDNRLPADGDVAMLYTLFGDMADAVESTHQNGE